MCSYRHIVTYLNVQWKEIFLLRELSTKAQSNIEWTVAQEKTTICRVEV